MKIFSNSNHLTGTILALLACASFASCSRSADREAMSGVPDQTTASASYDTASNTTVAANEETAAPSVPATETEASAKTETSTTTKSSKHMKSKHKGKKHHKDHSAWFAPAPAFDDRRNDQDVVILEEENGSVDATADYDYSKSETVSGYTRGPAAWGENGLSPFAQEPASRLPIQIGSGQMTGEDKSTTILDGPSLFQDPSALGRDLIH